MDFKDIHMAETEISYKYYKKKYRMHLIKNEAYTYLVIK